MEIWNSKYVSNMYFGFKVKFGVFIEVHFGQDIYLFEAQEFKNPKLQIVHKS